MALPASLLDPTKPKRPPGSFYRRWTWRRQVVASATRLLIAGSFVLLLWAAWYLANRGFGREFRTRVVEELRKRGIEATVRKLTLDPFRGLVARDVRIYDARHREQPLLAVNEVALEINYAALLHHQPFLNAIDVRDAEVAFPAPDADPNASKAQLKEFRAHVYFPPDQIYISQAEGIFCGIRVSATGQLLNRAGYQPTTGLTEEEFRARMELLQRIAVELGRFNFAGGPPTLQVKFSGNTDEIDRAHVEVTLNGERIQRGSYEMKTLAFAAEWIDQRLNIPELEWSDANGGFSARGSWERLTSRGEYQARSSIALKSFLDAFGFGSFVADLSFPSAPKIEISGVADFANATPHFTALGSVRAETFTYKTVPFSDLSAEFSWDGEHTLLREVHVRHATGDLTAEMLDAPNDFRLNFESSINPVPIRALFNDDLEKFFGDWELPRSPSLRMAIRGASHDAKTWTGDGSIAVQRARFRGVWANSATANVHLGQNGLTFKDLHVVRDEGIGTGAFTYDWAHHEVRIDNVHTHLRVLDVIYWIQPNFFRIVAPYKFHAPPNLVANGIVQYRGGEKTHLNISVDAPSGMDYVFINKTLPFDRVKANLLITDDRVQLSSTEGALFGGTVKGTADIITKETDPHYSASLTLDAVDFPKLTDLYFKFQTAHGLLAGKYDWTSRGDQARMMVGNGEFKVSNGDVFAIPIFGPLSTFLSAIVPGAGYSIAKQATATFSIRDGVIHTNDLKVSGKAYDMLGHGDIDFINDKMNMDMRIGARGAGAVLTPLYDLFEYKGEGSISKPNWHPKNF